MLNIISRRSFIERSLLTGAGLGLASLTNIPLVIKRALATGTIGLNGKKVFFIFLRGANDGLNNLLPYGDPNYINLGTGTSPIRPNILIPRDPTFTTNASVQTNPMDFFPSGNSDSAGIDTYAYNFGIKAGNGFAAVHPSLKFIAPVYNAGKLALVHRVGYPKQSRSHFDSQNYYETGQPLNNVDKEGVWYRAMYQYLLNNPSASLTGVSVQSALPLSLRGTKAAMTNLNDPTRYDMLGIPHVQTPNPNLGNSNDYWGDIKAFNAMTNANNASFPTRKSRELLQVQYKNVVDTLKTFADIRFDEGQDLVQPTPADESSLAGNVFIDDENTDGDRPYYLFPTTDIKNGGWRRLIGTNVGGRYVIPQNNGAGSYTFMRQVKAAALILNKTDARIAGTEIGGWDTHNGQVNSGDTTHGAHANLLRIVGWAIYGLYKFFKIYGIGGAKAMPNAKASWNDVTVVVMSEFGRTTIGNGTLGSDHAESNLMYVAGGAVKGLNAAGNTNSGSGIYECHTATTTSSKVPWNIGTYAGGQTGTGTLFDATGRYLQRAVDYRSVLGEIITKHLGANSAELQEIIPGYANNGEKLASGGTVTAPIDSQNTFIAGELNLL